VYNQSTYDQSYYNNNGMNVARTSTEGGFNSDAMSDGRYRNMQRTNSAAATGGRRQRPMTAKVKNSGLR
jgi:hypothetical protein